VVPLTTLTWGKVRLMLGYSRIMAVKLEENMITII
jgi:hypothetical protein